MKPSHPIRLLSFSAILIFVLEYTIGGTSFTPLTDMGADTYLGYAGGLYPDGMNALPPLHTSTGTLRALNIQPLNPDGLPDPNGKFVLLSIGMSNTTQEFCGNDPDGVTCYSWTFMGQAAANSLVDHTHLMIINGAAGGQVAWTWDTPEEANYDRIRDEILTPLDLSEKQVQVVWVKVANPNPDTPLPAIHADAYLLKAQMGEIVRALKTRYPNLQQVFLSSRVYAGYANTPLNPEPYAYESGFAVKWLIEAQINQMNEGSVDPMSGDLNYNTVAPWLAWGPYLWADGTNPRSDGLTWDPADFESDGTHPSQSGETKVGMLLLDFFLNSPQTSCWFRADQVCEGVSIYLPLVTLP